MSIRFNIDFSEVREFSQRLEKLHRSALPVAIRGTLNDAGFMMKKTTLPKQARLAFEERSPNFFKANSRVVAAVGFNVKTMVTTVGFISTGLHNPSTNYAVKDLEQQEHGGTIEGRSFKPLPGARKGGTGNVRANLRVSQLLKAGRVIDARDSKMTGTGKNGKMQQFILASIHAGRGGFVLGGKILWQVKWVGRDGRNGRFVMNKIFSFKKDGTARINHKTEFSRKAALEVQKEMEFFYKLQANKQFEKALKK